MLVRRLLPLTLACAAACTGGQNGRGLNSLEGSECAAVRSALNNGPLPEGCAKIEGDDLGREDVTLDVGDATVTINTWTAKEGSEGEYIGFTYTVTGEDVMVSVKAGTATHQDVGDGTWTHPAGTSGSAAKGISNIVFCPDPDGDGVPGGEEPSGGDNPGDPDDPSDGDDPSGEDPGSDDGCEPSGGDDGTPDDGDGTPDDGSDGTPDDGGDGTPDDGSMQGCESDADCPVGEYCGGTGQCVPNV
jgi:hypothetical protein